MQLHLINYQWSTYPSNTFYCFSLIAPDLKRVLGCPKSTRYDFLI